MSKYVTNFDIGAEKVYIYDSNIMHNEGLINVKFPPEGYSAAKGDGVADDTTAIMGLVRYASENKMALFFPAGLYSTTGLTIDNDVTFIGTEATLIQRANAVSSLISVNNAKFNSIGMTFNGNIGVQTEPINAVEFSGGSFNFAECNFTGVKDGINGEITNPSSLNNVKITNFTEYGIFLSGTSYVNAQGIIMTVSAAGAMRFVHLDNDANFIDGLTSSSEISVGVELTGNSNYVKAMIPGAETAVNDRGEGNNYEIEGIVKKETVSGDYTQNVENFTGTAKTKYKISGQDVELNPTNPLTYKSPTTFSPFFDSIKFKDATGNIYDVLVGNEKTSDITINGYYNFKDLGAVGDGVTDDTEIFKKINDVNGIVFVPPGQYVSNDEYNIHDSIIFFHPEAEVLLKGSGTNIHFVNCVIYNGIFNDSANNVTGGSLINLEGQSEIHNATFNCSNSQRIGAGAEQDSQILFRNCKFNGNETASTGLHCDRENNTTKLIVENCEFYDFMLNAIFSSALTGTYQNCYFNGNHRQTSPTGGGQIDVLSNNNNATHSILGCVFENSGGINTPGIETSNTTVLIQGCFVESNNANYGVTLQGGTRHTLIGNRFSTSKVCVFIDSNSCASFFSNYFDNTNQSPIHSEAQDSHGCVCFGNIVSGEQKQLFSFNESNPIGFYTINGEKNNITFTLAQGESVRINVGSSQYNNVMFTVDVNDSQAILLLSEFGVISWIGNIPSNLSASYAENVITFTNSGTGEHRYSLVKK